MPRLLLLVPPGMFQLQLARAHIHSGQVALQVAHAIGQALVSRTEASEDPPLPTLVTDDLSQVHQSCLGLLNFPLQHSSWKVLFVDPDQHGHWSCIAVIHQVLHIPDVCKLTSRSMFAEGHTGTDCDR